MHSKRRLATAGIAIALAATTTGVLAVTAQADPTVDRAVTWHLADLTAEQIAELDESGFDVASEIGDGAVLVLGDAETADDLRALGHDPTFHDTVYKDVQPGIRQAGTYYGGYRTVEAFESHLDDVASNHPGLTRRYDIGDSWRKTQGLGGHDIYALCVTKIADGDCELAPDSEKPRFTLVTQIHAREIATGEIAARWIDLLVDGYGTDPAITSLMDTTEMWVVPVANPDGLDIVASGGDSPVLQRKNANDSVGSCGSSFGVDLNRNSTFAWGNDSTNPCSQTYQGVAAGSEPEVAAVEGLLRSVHPDQRGASPDDPAPDDARDVFISLHSYGNFIIVPWGYTDAKAPNDTQLRSLGAAMAEANGYRVGTGSETVGYGVSGTTDDMAYGELGVASFTYEIGPNRGTCGGFFPAYGCIDDLLWPLNRGALMTAAEAAAAPYGGDPAPPEDEVVRYEAEDAPATCDGTIASNHAGYSGTGFCDTPNTNGTAAQFTVTSESAREATVRVRFANGSSGGARGADVVVNGSTVASASFEVTGSWSTWSTKTLTVPLNAGNNTIRLVATGADGLPNIDYLDLVVPDPGGSGDPVRYEAESAQAVCDGTIASNHAGYSGTGFCDTPNTIGTACQFTVTADSAGTATVEIRFANGSSGGARGADVVVNGSTVTSTTFENTGGWSTWGTKTVTVPLNAGNNTVRLVATGSGGLPNIDYLEM